MFIKKKIDLCIDARMLSSTGIGTCLKQILQGFIKTNFINKKSIVLLTDKNNLKKYDWLKHFKIKHFNAKIYSIKEQLLLPLKIPSCKCFFSPHFNVPLLPIKAKHRIVTICDLFHLENKKDLNFSHYYYAKILIKKACKTAEKIITISTFSKNKILEYIKNIQETKIEKIYPGIDLNKNKIFLKKEKNYIKEKYNIKTNFILFVGNIKLHKNIKRLIEAFNLLKIKDYQLIIVGSNKIKNSFPIENYLSTNILHLKNVPDNELNVIYSLATATILPSLYEGFGLPPLESMFFGSCAIVSNICSMPEIYKNAALYVNPFSPDDIAEKIKLIIENNALRKSLQEKSLQLLNDYNCEKEVEAYIKILEKYTI